MKSIVFKSSYDYYNYLLSDLSKCKDIYVYDSPLKLTIKQRVILKILNLLNNKKKLIKIYNMLLNIFEEIFPNIPKYADASIIVFDNFVFYEDDRFHNWIRSINGNGKLISINYNVISKNEERLKNLKKKYDVNYSFDLENCKENDFNHFWGIYSSVKVSNISTSIDLFFLGLDKGRYPILKEIYDELKVRKFKTNFIVISDDVSPFMMEGFIVQNQRVSYAESILGIENTECILEIVTNEQNGLSLRAIEALVYNKKLLTNNKSILKSPYYNQEFIQYFDKVSDIDFNFLLRKIKVNYNCESDFSPINLINQINSKLKDNK